jgi:hypothetical protein
MQMPLLVQFGGLADTAVLSHDLDAMDAAANVARAALQQCVVGSVDDPHGTHDLMQHYLPWLHDVGSAAVLAPLPVMVPHTPVTAVAAGIGTKASAAIVEARTRGGNLRRDANPFAVSGGRRDVGGGDAPFVRAADALKGAGTVGTVSIALRHPVFNSSNSATVREQLLGADGDDVVHELETAIAAPLSPLEEPLPPVTGSAATDDRSVVLRPGSDNDTRMVQPLSPQQQHALDAHEVSTVLRYRGKADATMAEVPTSAILPAATSQLVRQWYEIEMEVYDFAVWLHDQQVAEVRARMTTVDHAPGEE